MHSDKLDMLAQALVGFQSRQESISKNAVNPFLKNKYADLTALVDGVKKNLEKHGLAVTQLLEREGLTTYLIHESGQYIGAHTRIEPTEAKGTNAAQQMGIAITYTRRYAFASILGLVTDEDTDGSTPKKKETKPETKPQTNTSIISEPQRKRLMAIMNNSQATKEDAKVIISNFGYESSKDIKKSDYEEICRQVEDFEPQPDEDDNGEPPNDLDNAVGSEDLPY